MIEIVKEKELPKNFCQIGERESNRRIYIEDYVITYLRQMADTMQDDMRVFILYGRKEIIEYLPTYFVCGALEATDISFYERNLIDEHDWHHINEKAAKFFPDLSILGWAVISKKEIGENREQIDLTWRQFFREDQQMFYYACTTELTEDLYCFESGQLKKQQGYYVYYDKNEAMQNYMLSARPEEKEDGDYSCKGAPETGNDHATRQFRSIIQEKKEEIHHRRTMSFLYAASSVLVMVIMIIGITMLNNYEKMEHMEHAISELSGQVEDGFAESASKEDSVEDAVVLAESTASLQKKEEQFKDEKVQQSEQKQGETAQTIEQAQGEIAQAVERTQQKEAQVPEQAQEIDANPQPENAETSKEDGPQPENTEPSKQVQTPQVAEASANYTVYEVQKGDTLVKISLTFYGTDAMVDEICALNKITNKDTILYGEKIYLP